MRLSVCSVHTANGISVKHVRLAFTGPSHGKAPLRTGTHARDTGLTDQASRPPCDVCQQVCFAPPPAWFGTLDSAEASFPLMWLRRFSLMQPQETSHSRRLLTQTTLPRHAH
jgi:hypothetical protein